MNQVYPTTVNVMLDLLSAAGRACTNIHYAIESDHERGIRYDDIDLSVLAFTITAARDTVRTAVDMPVELSDSEEQEVARIEEHFSDMRHCAAGSGWWENKTTEQRMCNIAWNAEYKVSDAIGNLRTSVESRCFVGRDKANDDE